MKLLLFIFTLFLFFSSCKKWQHKYPEDIEKTKETPKERLANKWWTLSNTTLNGKDYTDSVFKVFGKYQIFFSSNTRSVFNGI